MTVWGHPPERIWDYTPRQAAAWAVLGFARKRAERAEALEIATLADREKTESINRKLKEWGDA